MIKYYLRDPALSFERKTAGASGFDLHAFLVVDDVSCTLEPGEHCCFGTGLHLAMPLGIEAQVRPRSGLAREHAIAALLGTLDSDYRGEVKVTLVNHGSLSFVVRHMDRIAQLVFAPVVIPGTILPARVVGRHCVDHLRWPDIVRVDSIAELGATERGDAGFGSTGR
ncbi:MAG: dUTP diphosphatase [Kofleriaceae bacterium]